MSAAAIRGVVRRLGPSDPPADADLVSAFAAERDADAFAALVDRHGPTVLGVCQRVLGNTHDAEDAFQAVFLVLARKVGAVRPPGAVGGWLYGVAVRTANKARVASARRRRREMIAATERANPDREGRGGVELAELRAALDEAIGKLPEALRAVVVLCDLHGKTRAEAAGELGCPEGTVAARLHRARKKLGESLARRGLALPTAGIATLLVPAAVSASAARSAIAAALGSASPAVLTLAREVTRGMSTTTHAIAFGAITLLAGGLLAAGSLLPSDPPKPPPAQKPLAELKVDQAPSSDPWKEKKVLEVDGLLAGSVVYSGDGKVLFVGGTSGGGHVRAFSTDGFKLLWEFKDLDQFSALALSPDGKTLAVTVKDGVQFLDAATGKTGDKLEESGSEPITVAYFPDIVASPGVAAHKVIFGNARGYFVKSWLAWPQVGTTRTSTVAEGAKPADDHAVPIAVSSDGKRVVVTGPIDRENGKNVLWAWSAGSGEANKLLAGHKAVVTCAAWSKDGKTILTGDAEGIVIAWEGETFQEKSRRRIGPRIAAVAISPDGKTFAAAVAALMPAPNKTEAYTEEVYVWEDADPPAQLKPLFGNDAGGPFKGVASLAFAPDGKSLAAAFANFTHLSRLGELVGKVRIFTIAGEQRKEKPGFVSDVGFSPDSKRFFVLKDGRANVFDADTGQELYTAAAEAARFTADGKWLVAMGPREVAVHEIERGPITNSHHRAKTKWGWHRVAFAPDGKRYAAHFGHFAGVFDVASGFEPVRLVEQLESGGGSLVGVTGKDIIFSPDGKKVGALGVLVNPGKVGAAVWDAETGKRLLIFEPVLAESPQSIAFSPSSEEIAVGWRDRVEVWAPTGEVKKNPLRRFNTAAPVTALGYSSDGRLLAAGVRMPVLRDILRSDVPPDGRRFSHRSEVLILDVQSAQERQRLWGFEQGAAITKLPVLALAFSPDGKRILACTGLPMMSPLSDDPPTSGEFRTWDLDVVAPPVVPPPAPPPQLQNKALEKFQGPWQLAGFDLGGGNTLTDEEIAGLGWTLTIEKNTFQFADRDGKKTSSGRIAVDPSQSPPVLIRIATDREQDIYTWCLYELKGDTLRLCQDVREKGRPKEFKATAYTTIATYKRAKR